VTSDRFHIDPDIRRATTLPAAVYASPQWFERVRDRVLARGWHLVADSDRLRVPGACHPTTLLEGVLDEPLLFTRDGEDRLHCVSNVCTHRGALVCDGDQVAKSLRCRYHGRRFALDGRFLSMPEFEGAIDFPSESDSLPRHRWAQWGRMLFAALDPAMPFEDLVAGLHARIGWLPIDRAVLDPTRCRDYIVRANWALYCDNYLEGFHIPYVHAALAGALDYGAYRTEVFRWSSLQVGIATGGEDAFEPPAGSPEHGQRVAGYYFWLFPCTMLNVYPWGISVNAVRPLAVDRTRVSYLTYVWDESRLDRGAGSGLDRVEREDEAVVESVQRGVRSRAYRHGRYSPRRETGIHHFHCLLAAALNRTGM
jgi:choline monooxygenase